MEKLTKIDYLNHLKGMVEGSEQTVAIETADLVAFIDHEIELIEKKAVRAKEAQAKRKVDGDSLRDAIQGALTEELQTIDALLGAIESDEVLTPAKIVPRLSQLVKLGVATKEDVSIEGRKVKGYKLA